MLLNIFFKLFYFGGKQMDRRTEKTRTAIFDAFITLISKKSYSKITIQEIIDTANIGRSTFYAHFETKDTLLKEFCKEMFMHVFSNNLSAETTHDFSSAQGDLRSYSTHILYHLRDEEKHLQGVLLSTSSNLFWDYIKQQISLSIANLILELRTEKSKSIPDDLLIIHISTSFINLIKWWMNKGMKDSPETIESFFEDLIYPIL